MPAPVPRPVFNGSATDAARRRGSFVDVAGVIVKPAVVNIFATRNGAAKKARVHRSRIPFRTLLRRGVMKRFKRRRSGKQGLGSGVIVDANGIIIDTNHVVNKADEIKVFLAGQVEVQSEARRDGCEDRGCRRPENRRRPACRLVHGPIRQAGSRRNPAGSGQSWSDQTVTLASSAQRVAGIAGITKTSSSLMRPPIRESGRTVNAREFGRHQYRHLAVKAAEHGNRFAVPSNMAHSIMDQLVQQRAKSRGWLAFPSAS